jgi:hypothetical protein
MQSISSNEINQRRNMTLPVLFEGFMMLQDIGNEFPVPYLSPVGNASSFHEAYSSFIKPTELEARGVICRDHSDYLSDLSNDALAQLETWEPTAFVMKVTVDFKGDIYIPRDGLTLTKEEVYESANMEIPRTLHAHVPKQVDQDADINSEDVKFAIAFVRLRLKQPDQLQLFNTILSRALKGNDPEFTNSFVKWLGPDGGTIILRDELCRPFQSIFEHRKVEGRQNLSWQNAWTGIDSAKLAYREEFRVGSLMTSENNDEDTSYATPRM